MIRRLQAQLVAALNQQLAGGRPVVPEAGVLLWNLFADIAASRTWHAAGPHPISHAEIEAYARLHRWPLQPHHVTTIRALDDAWIEHALSRSAGSPTSGGPAPFTASQPVNAAAFDAVFG